MIAETPSPFMGTTAEPWRWATMFWALYQFLLRRDFYHRRPGDGIGVDPAPWRDPFASDDFPPEALAACKTIGWGRQDSGDHPAWARLVLLEGFTGAAGTAPCSGKNGDRLRATIGQALARALPNRFQNVGLPIPDT